MQRNVGKGGKFEAMKLEGRAREAARLARAEYQRVRSAAEAGGGGGGASAEAGGVTQHKRKRVCVCVCLCVCVCVRVSARVCAVCYVQAPPLLHTHSPCDTHTT
jgi:hypothetical protein